MIEKLRQKGRKDLYIAACIEDIYQICLICDDAAIADAAGISDEVWEKMLNDQPEYKSNALRDMWLKLINSRAD